MSRIPKGDILGLRLLNFFYTCNFEYLQLLIVTLPIFPSRVLFTAYENKYGKHNMSAFLRV